VWFCGENIEIERYHTLVAAIGSGREQGSHPVGCLLACFKALVLENVFAPQDLERLALHVDPEKGGEEGG
jgi:hypothetical protein